MNAPYMLTLLYHACYFNSHVACMSYKHLWYRHAYVTCMIHICTAFPLDIPEYLAVTLIHDNIKQIFIQPRAVSLSKLFWQGMNFILFPKFFLHQIFQLFGIYKIYKGVRSATTIYAQFYIR